MKFNRFITASTVVIICFLAYQCKKTNEVSQPELPDISVVDISQESDWDYWLVGPENYFYIKENNSLPVAVSYHSAEHNKDISIFFDNGGLPNKVVIDDYIYLFDNFNGTKVDIGALSPNGDIEIIREVETNFNWDNYNAKLGKITGWSDVVNWTGRVVGGIPCALTAAAAVASGGLFVPVTAFVCGSYILSLAADITTDEFGIHNGFTDFVDTYGMAGTAISCSSGHDAYLSCATGAASSALDSWADDLAEIENRENEVQVVAGALRTGSGDVQITLTWNTTNDIDLWVTDPNGEKIYFADPTSTSGGYLDYDDTNGYGPENVFWPQYEAPSGTYHVQVHHYSGSYSTNFTVLVQAFGFIKQYEGNISPNETISVVEFHSNTPLPKIQLNAIIFSEINEPK